jgi:hypothetical protein
MTKCRNPEMVKRINYLQARVDVLKELASTELVGPTEWAEAVSLCRYAVDRVGECGGAALPVYGVSNG